MSDMTTDPTKALLDPLAEALAHHATLNAMLESVVEAVLEQKLATLDQKKQEISHQKTQPISAQGSPGRRQISTREAARILSYHPKYLCRNAEKWNLTKIHMSSRSCRFYLDEIEALQKERAW